MTIKRKLVRQHKSIVCVIPKALVDILGLDVGDELLFKLADENKRLMVTPVPAAKREASAPGQFTEV